MCTPKKSEKTKDGKKKRRLDDASGSSLSSSAMLCVQPLLLCLEYSLRADAQDGGKWIRADDDGQRYRSILEPLGQLLQAKVPIDYPGADGNITPYLELVQGGLEGAAGVSGR